MTIKTVAMTGTEIAVTGLDGAHVHIRNDGTDTIYAAKVGGIIAGASGVLSISAGQAGTIRGAAGTVYLLGTGSVLVLSDDCATSPFEISAQAGGSGADEVARAAISTHAGNTEIHVTTVDKARWNGIPNPNLLINPDFSINQRDVSGTIVDVGYFVDCWKLISGSVVINSDGSITLNGSINQVLEKTIDGTVVASASAGTASYDSSTKTFTLTASGDTITWAKLELGNITTPFCPPDTAIELAKCQRYFQRFKNTKEGAFVFLGSGYAFSSIKCWGTIPLYVPLRSASACTVTLSGTLYCANTNALGATAIAAENVNSTISEKASAMTVTITASGFTNNTPVLFQFRDTTSYIDISSEL